MCENRFIEVPESGSKAGHEVSGLVGKSMWRVNNHCKGFAEEEKRITVVDGSSVDIISFFFHILMSYLDCFVFRGKWCVGGGCFCFRIEKKSQKEV